MKRTAIIAAMHEELRGLLEPMRDAHRVVHAGREFWCGRLEDRPVVVGLSRVGKVAAATTASVLLSALEVERIVFTGTAGGLADGVQIGDVVVAHGLLQHDMDASPLFPRYEIPLYGTDRFACDPQVTQTLMEAARLTMRELGALAARVHCGLVVSGDRFVSTCEDNDDLRARLPDALAVEMEGAATAQVCTDFGIPFGVMRIVSDRADASAHVDFASFVTEVASRYCETMVRHYLRLCP